MDRRRKWRTMETVLLLLFLYTGLGFGQEVIYKITLLGNIKIEEGVIRGAIKSREGGPFSLDQIREDLRAIFALNYFTDVQVDIQTAPQGKEVIFIVVEKPSIKEVLITGNKKLKTEEIKEKVTLTPRSILNLQKVKETSEAIRAFYFSKGYYGVKVEHKIDYLETNEAVVTFQITEGPKGHIQKMIFKGNQKIKTKALKKLMATKESSLWSFIMQTGLLDEETLKKDIQLLNAYYYDQGYLNAKVSEPKIDLRNPKKIQIEINIVEGPQYRLGTIDFKGDILTTKEDLFRVIKIKRKDVYQNSAIRKDVGALTENFANQGYAYVEITPETAIDPQQLLVHLTFNIERKKRVSFERIQVSGNTKTRDKVVRRELQFAEGELYNVAALTKSRNRLKRTGYFKEVDLLTSPGSTDEKINLEVKVEEAPTGAVSFGIGYSSVENVIGSTSISDRNLFGLGYQGSLRFQLGSETRDIRLSFTDPYFLGYRYSAGFDLYHEQVEYFTTYAYRILGGDIRFGKELTDTLRIDTMYKLEEVDIYDVALDAPQTIKDQIGKSTTSALSLTFSSDTRNDFFTPSRGARNSFFIQNAGGPLGADNYFVKGLLDGSWFFPMPLSTVLNLRAKYGRVEPYGNKKVTELVGGVLVEKDRGVPVYEKFFVGGLHTVRGFEYGFAGPVDPVTEEALGAENMLVFNAELIIPLSRAIGLRGALFFDAGKGYNRVQDDRFWYTDPLSGRTVHSPDQSLFPLRTGAGVGIRWFSPFGPIHIDMGWNLSPREGEKSRVFDFTAGTVF
jgi:outer membrane protein insertion porin family